MLMGLSSFMFSGRQAHNVEWIIVLQDHPKSSILVPVEGAYTMYTFLLVVNNNMDPILHRFRDTAA